MTSLSAFTVKVETGAKNFDVALASVWTLLKSKLLLHGDNQINWNSIRLEVETTLERVVQREINSDPLVIFMLHVQEKSSPTLVNGNGNDKSDNDEQEETESKFNRRRRKLNV